MGKYDEFYADIRKKFTEYIEKNNINQDSIYDDRDKKNSAINRFLSDKDIIEFIKKNTDLEKDLNDKIKNYLLEPYRINKQPSIDDTNKATNLQKDDKIRYDRHLIKEFKLYITKNKENNKKEDMISFCLDFINTLDDDESKKLINGDNIKHLFEVFIKEVYIGNQNIDTTFKKNEFADYKKTIQSKEGINRYGTLDDNTIEKMLTAKKQNEAIDSNPKIAAAYEQIKIFKYFEQKYYFKNTYDPKSVYVDKKTDFNAINNIKNCLITFKEDYKSIEEQFNKNNFRHQKSEKQKVPSGVEKGKKINPLYKGVGTSGNNKPKDDKVVKNPNKWVRNF